jgi:hypothetical protein
MMAWYYHLSPVPDIGTEQGRVGRHHKNPSLARSMGVGMIDHPWVLIAGFEQRYRPYFSPRNLPVELWMKCSLAHAGHTTDE